MASMYDRVVAIVSKPPDERTDRDIDMLLPWFRKKSELFAAQKTDVVSDIVRNCEFVTKHRDDVIITQGEQGNCLYMILAGKVGIYINNSEEEDISILAEKLKASAQIAKEKGDDLDRSKYGNYITQFDAGKSFGELALISKDCIRNASIIADDDLVDLIVVNRELYNRSLHASQAAEFEERTNFVAHSPLFVGWNPKYRRQMSMSIVKEVFQFDDLIVKQGEPIKKIYFLMRGQAKVMIDTKSHHSQYPHLNLDAPISEFVPEEDEPEFMVNTPKQKREPTPSVDWTGPVAPSASKRRDCRKRSTEICSIGNNDMFGDLEFVLDLKTYLQSVRTTQVCHLYSLDMKNYERLVTRRNPRTIEVLREFGEVKLRSRIDRMPDDKQVPLFKALLYKLQVIKHPTVKRQKTPVAPSSALGGVDFGRGPLIDQYGPGTVFYRIKNREMAKKKAKNLQKNFRGATLGFGMSITPTIQPGATENPVQRGNTYGGSDPTFLTNRAPAETKYYDYNENNQPNNSADHSEEEEVMSDSDEEDCIPESARGRTVHLGGPSFDDYESSDRVLTDLEDRIKAWHSSLGEDEYRNHRKQPQSKPVRMHRLSIEGRDVKPGVKIRLRKRNKPLRHPRLAVDSGTESEDDDMNLPQPQHYTNPSHVKRAKETIFPGRVQRIKENFALATTVNGTNS